MRERRLTMDHQRMHELAAACTFVRFTCEGSPPDRYEIRLGCGGLAWSEARESPEVREDHVFTALLHREYPRKPPLLHWESPIFHPNILGPDRNGGVCIGAWTPAESLDRLVIRLAEMVQYRRFNLDDPLDPDAAGWARRNPQRFPVDDRILEPGDTLTIELGL